MTWLNASPGHDTYRRHDNCRQERQRRRDELRQLMTRPRRTRAEADLAAGVFDAAESLQRGRKVVVHDRMQRRYVYYRSEPVGRNFAPGFKPQLTPRQMLALGVFGGKYMTDCRDEFPKIWFRNARLSPTTHDPTLNLFGVNASLPLSVWRKNGWIYHEDPRGWFQWYCRYYMGRRSPDDERQVRRWRAVKRHIAQIRKHCRRGDLACRRRQRQALLHWAYDSRKI